MVTTSWKSELRQMFGSVPLRFLMLFSVFTASYWGWIWLTPLWHPDDYMLATRSNMPFGQFLWVDVADGAWRSFWEINGRLSDAVTQVAISSLHLVVLFAVVLHLASALGTYLCAEVFFPETEKNLRIVLLAFSFLFPFALIQHDPAQSGEVFHFFAATVSTLGGYCSAVWTLWFSVKAQQQKSLKGYFWAAAVVFLATGLMHELSAFFLLPALLVLIAANWKASASSVERFLLVPILSLVLLRLAVPGMWRRVGVVNENVYSDEAVLTHFDRLVISFAGFFAHPAPLLLLFLIFLFILSHVLIPRTKRIRPDTPVAVLGLLSVIGWIYLGKRVYALMGIRGAEGTSGLHEVAQSHSGHTLFFVVAITCLCASYIVIRISRECLSWLFSAIFFGAMLTALIPLSLANSFGRQLFFLELFVYVMILVLLGALGTHRIVWLQKMGLILGGLYLASIAVSVVNYTVDVIETFEEYSKILSHQVELVRQGESTVIDTRGIEVHPYIFHSSFLQRQDMKEAIPIFYGLDSDTEVVLP